MPSNNGNGHDIPPQPTPALPIGESIRFFNENAAQASIEALQIGWAVLSLAKMGCQFQIPPPIWDSPAAPAALAYQKALDSHLSRIGLKSSIILP